ncbi:MAG: hypothetical protein EOS61_02985 [Mesorhizobium sp.]|nr:MAG: hypothetical protein EOS61_02985 [Mesorhizobium sp.]
MSNTRSPALALTRGAFAPPTGLTTFGCIGKVTGERHFACRRCGPAADRCSVSPLRQAGR